LFLRFAIFPIIEVTAEVFVPVEIVTELIEIWYQLVRLV